MSYRGSAKNPACSSGAEDAAVHDVFCRTRIDELFDMIHEFPDSERAVLELRTALEVTQQHGLLASVLRDTLQRRLLHPVGRQEG